MDFKVSRQKFQQKFQTKRRYIDMIQMLPGILFSIALLVSICLWSSSAMCAKKKHKPKFPVISIPENAKIPKNAKGERAIDVLADKLPEVATWYGKTAKQFSTMLRTDHTARIDNKGRLLYIEEKPKQTSVDDSPLLAEGPFPNDQTFKLHSKPGSKRVIFLDFDGDTITNSAWNNYYGEPIVAKPYDFDGDKSSFSNSEMDRIQNIWLLVSEDFAPFDVDVTTEDPGQDAITRSSNSDDRYGTKVVMTKDNFASCGCGGFAYVGVFDNIGNYYKPAFVFNESLVGAAEAASHEAGHNLGLGHDGTVNGVTYYAGHGNGDTGWAPIMGVGYYKKLVQWSNGEYLDANNTQDDIQIIQNNGLEIKADDHGNDAVTSTVLDNTTDGTTITLSGKGLIERRTDVDAFRFVCGNGDLLININPSPFSPNLDIEAGLYNSNGTLITSSNPRKSLNASFSELTLPAGEYFLKINGIGKGAPEKGYGYTDYASLGNYTISGSIPGLGGLKYPVAVATVDPSVSGYAPLTLNFYGNESYDTDGSIVRYEWNFGDGSNPSTNVTPNHTYYTPGNYMATLTVTDNDGLTNSATVAITVYHPETTITLNSIGAEDGWVRESLENSNVGGRSNSTGAGPVPIRQGDHKDDRQNKSFLSFDTSLIPGNATVLSATLRLRRGNVKGTNPFQTHGTCWVDVTTGGFSGNTALQNSDFEAEATVAQSASLSNAASNGSWSIADLDQAGLEALNTEGKTQFRIYFELDDNDDQITDYIGYYSSDNLDAANHPQLVITYK